MLSVALTAYSQERAAVPRIDEPPKRENPEQTSKDQKESKSLQEITVTLPSTINVSVTGKLDLSTQQTQTDNNREKQDVGDWIKRFLFDIKITDFFIALFTGLLWFATIKLARIANQQETSARTHERSYVFGNPKFGTPGMQKQPTVAIDVPLKALVWEDDQGKVWLTYNSAEYLQNYVYPRHGLPSNPDAVKSGAAVLADFAQQATE